MDESPGVLLRDGRREDFEDLAEVETVVRVQGAGEPHDYKLHGAGSLANYLTHCAQQKINLQKK